MKILKTLLCLSLLAATSVVLANEARVAAPSFEDDGIVLESESAVSAVEVPAGKSEVFLEKALSELRESQRQQFASLESRLTAGISNEERLKIENELVELKEASQRNELELLLEMAESRGDERYAEKLREAMNHQLSPASVHAKRSAAEEAQDAVGTATPSQKGGAK